MFKLEVSAAEKRKIITRKPADLVASDETDHFSWAKQLLVKIRHQNFILRLIAPFLSIIEVPHWKNL